MTSELNILLFTILFGFLQLFISTALTTKIRGIKWNLSSREGPPPPLTGVAGRVDRAFQNFKETFPFFIAAIVLVTLTGSSGTISQISAWTYLVARLLYFPVYAFDITVVRTGLWSLSLIGILGLLLEIFI